MTSAIFFDVGHEKRNIFSAITNRFKKEDGVSRKFHENINEKKANYGDTFYDFDISVENWLKYFCNVLRDEAREFVVPKLKKGQNSS